jgi:hypothetical protein
MNGLDIGSLIGGIVCLILGGIGGYFSLIENYRRVEGRCPNCGACLKKFPARYHNQRCPTKEEIKRGHYD